MVIRPVHSDHGDGIGTHDHSHHSRSSIQRHSHSLWRDLLVSNVLPTALRVHSDLVVDRFESGSALRHHRLSILIHLLSAGGPTTREAADARLDDLDSLEHLAGDRMDLWTFFEHADQR